MRFLCEEVARKYRGIMEKRGLKYGFVSGGEEKDEEEYGRTRSV